MIKIKLSQSELCIYVSLIDVWPPQSLYSGPFSSVIFKKKICFID